MANKFGCGATEELNMQLIYNSLCKVLANLSSDDIFTLFLGPVDEGTFLFTAAREQSTLELYMSVKEI